VILLSLPDILSSEEKKSAAKIVEGKS